MRSQEGGVFAARARFVLLSRAMKRSLAFGLLFAAACPSGCAGQKLGPEVASSATETNYALDYPWKLQAVTNDYVNGEGDVRRIATAFAKYPDQLRAPPWPIVRTIVERADEAGRSAAYVDAHREWERTEKFFTQERDDITRRVAGSTQYVLKKSEKTECDVDVSGAVAASLREAVDKELEKRLRSHNEAHVVIERHRDSLGRSNAAALERQADDISEASYLVFIHAVELNGRALGLLDEASRVRRTLEKSADDERAIQAQPGRSAAEKKAANERIARIEAAKVRIDGTLPQVQALANEIDRRNDALRKEYDGALDGLKRALASKSTSK
jgi:hypothetical protein